jgi:chaperonin cofactor prefoldin
MTVLSTAVFVVGTFFCGGGGKYADAKKAMAKSNQALEAFLEGMEKAENADQVAKVLDDFNKKMGTIMPEMRKLEEKYPELMNRQQVPPELGEVGQKTMELWMKFPNVLMKAQQYADDERVQKAMDELQSILN